MSDMTTFDSDLSAQGYTDQEIRSMLTDGWRLTPATTAYKITRGKWIPARHLLSISTIIASAIAQGRARIILCMPPRHGKSEFLSVNTPIWFLEKYPTRNVMGISYGLDLATEFSPRVRDTFLDEDNHHLLHTRISPKKMRVDRFYTTAGGGYIAAGIGGVITGRGAHLMLIDDYIKNAEDAMSETQRRKNWDWFKSTAYTRLEPGGSIVILATRWNIDDLIGRCLTELAHENWIVINYPAIAVANDPLGRKPGEALWPERYPVSELEAIKATLGTYWWEAMYQQDPRESMAGLELGEKLRVCSEADLPHPNHLVKLRAWDMASGEAQKDDYTAGPLTATYADRSSGKFFILDMQRFKKSPHNTEVMVKAVAAGDGHGTKIWMEQEPGSSGKTVIDHYAADVLPGFDFKAERATGPIEVRAAPFLAAVEAGTVIAVDGPWVKDLRKELNSFPDGDHDDQIAALALAYNKSVSSKYTGVVWGKKSQEANRRAAKRQSNVIFLSSRRRSSVTW